MKYKETYNTNITTYIGNIQNSFWYNHLSRRLPCDFNTEFLLNVYTNTEYEAEVRIAAYLQIMKCPTYGTIKQIKTMLETEKLNQGNAYDTDCVSLQLLINKSKN